MTILLLMVLIVLIFIAFKLNSLVKIQSMSAELKPESTVSTTLNPLFSEKEISAQRTLSEHWEKRMERAFEILEHDEEQEIERHVSSEKNHLQFIPSDNLKRSLLNVTFSVTGLKVTEDKLKRMIEANISVLNGMPISEASKIFYSNKEGDNIFWNNINSDASNWSNDEFIRTQYEENLKQRIDYWQKRKV